MQLTNQPEENIEKRALELIELVGLEERADHFPSQLSGGEQQRAAFARAFANNPPLVLADEPTGNLDLDTGLRIVDILEGLRTKKTVIVATHDERILGISDRVLTLSKGRLSPFEG